MIVDDMKRKLMEAMKAKDEVTKDILRVVIAEIQLQESKVDSLSEDKVVNLIRKVIENNNTTIGLLSDEVKISYLKSQNEVLGSFLPKILNKEELKGLSTKILDSIKDCSNNGLAIKTFVEYLKGNGYHYNGKDVSEVVVDLRK